jgi:hypothetical protein
MPRYQPERDSYFVYLITPARLTKTGDYTLFLKPQSVSQNVNGAREHQPESETDISARGRTNLAVERCYRLSELQRIVTLSIIHLYTT